MYSPIFFLHTCDVWHNYELDLGRRFRSAKQGQMPFGEVVIMKWTEDVAEALHYVRQQGLVHRDVIRDVYIPKRKQRGPIRRLVQPLIQNSAPPSFKSIVEEDTRFVMFTNERINLLIIQ